MNIKLINISRLSYYFCGSISLSTVNNQSQPLVVELESLTREEVIGLNRALTSNIIDILEGKDEFVTLAQSYVTKKKKEVVTPVVEDVQPIVEPVIETVVEEVKDTSVETVTEQVEEKTEEVVAKPKTTRRTSTAKK